MAVRDPDAFVREVEALRAHVRAATRDEPVQQMKRFERWAYACSALGLVTDTGSKTSHAVIVARSMKVPAVVGVRDFSKRAQDGDWAIVDGYDGVVILHPSESTLFRYGKIQEKKKSFEQRMLDVQCQVALDAGDHGVTWMDYDKDGALVASGRGTYFTAPPK